MVWAQISRGVEWLVCGRKQAGRKIRVKKSREKIADGTKKERAEARTFLDGRLADDVNQFIDGLLGITEQLQERQEQLSVFAEEFSDFSAVGLVGDLAGSCSLSTQGDFPFCAIFFRFAR